VWQKRATFEYYLSERTWWTTLSYRGNHEPSYEDVKKFFKRLRKKHSFRYVISEERGAKHERLHWHILIHCGRDLTRRRLEKSWGHGFVHPRLAISGGLGGYLAKYLAKQSRIRASRYYGKFDYFYGLLDRRTQAEFETFVRTGKKIGRFVGSGIEVTPWGVALEPEQAAQILKDIKRDRSNDNEDDGGWNDIPF
jgi:hypothetical protein